MQLHVLMPVYNDWPSAEQVLRDLDRAAAAHGLHLSATLVDDGSTEAAAWPPDFSASLSRFSDIEILHLQRNCGQSLAVTVGLAHLLRRGQDRPVLLMDADGQDRPENVPRLTEVFREDPERLLMAERRERTESLLFRLCYFSFQSLFRLLAGKSFRIGLFGIYPKARIAELLRYPSLRRSVAGTVIASGLAERFIEVDRGTRHFGQSRFGLRGHIRHAWDILVVNRARILSRVARASGIVSAVALAATALHVAMAETARMDLWTMLGLSLAILCGAISVGLAMARRTRVAEATPSSKALCAELVDRVGILAAPAATPSAR